jgi:hypothetical protein
MGGVEMMMMMIADWVWVLAYSEPGVGVAMLPVDQFHPKISNPRVLATILRVWFRHLV